MRLGSQEVSLELSTVKSSGARGKENNIPMRGSRVFLGLKFCLHGHYPLTSVLPSLSEVVDGCSQPSSACMIMFWSSQGVSG